MGKARRIGSWRVVRFTLMVNPCLAMAFQAIPGGLIGGPVPAAPVQVGNIKERDPPIFRGLPHEDVMEWSYQFQRVSAFNQWWPAQQYRHIEFSLEGVAAKWLTGLIRVRRQLMD